MPPESVQRFFGVSVRGWLTEEINGQNEAEWFEHHCYPWSAPVPAERHLVELLKMYYRQDQTSDEAPWRPPADEEQEGSYGAQQKDSQEGPQIQRTRYSDKTVYQKGALQFYGYGPHYGTITIRSLPPVMIPKRLKV